MLWRSLEIVLPRVSILPKFHTENSPYQWVCLQKYSRTALHGLHHLVSCRAAVVGFSVISIMQCVYALLTDQWDRRKFSSTTLLILSQMNNMSVFDWTSQHQFCICFTPYSFIIWIWMCHENVVVSSQKARKCRSLICSSAVPSS